jgi:hypothetical protein
MATATPFSSDPFSTSVSTCTASVPRVAVVTGDGQVQLNKNVVNGTEPILRLIGDLPAGTPVASGAAYGRGWLVELRGQNSSARGGRYERSAIFQERTLLSWHGRVPGPPGGRRPS